MSVEKLVDESQTSIEANPFTQICNSVIEHIKDNDAFRIYAFSLSKSTNWKVLKEYTGKVCGVGMRKGKFVWSYLKRCGLIDYVRIVDKETGKYLRTDIKVLNGTKFDMTVEFLDDKTTGAETAPLEITTGAVSTGAVSARAEMYTLRNKDIRNKEEQNKEREQQKEKPSLSCVKNEPISEMKITVDEFQISPKLSDDLETIPDLTTRDLTNEYYKFKEYYSGETNIRTTENWERQLRLWMLRAAAYKQQRGNYNAV